MGLVDWNAIWNAEIVLSRRMRLNAGSFWDYIAACDRGHDGFTDVLTTRQLERIAAGADDTVLEIGPGMGRLTIPLARSARAVTVIDPSAGMLARLRERCQAAGVTNLTMLTGAWEDADHLVGLAPHSLVIASYSLFMLDMRVQLERMRRFASRRVCLFVPAAPRMPEAIERILFGTVVTTRLPDHVVLFNLLHDLGVDASVEVLRETRERRYDSLQDAIDERMRFYDAPEAKRGEIAAFVESQVRSSDQGVVMSQEVATGVVGWRVE